MDDRADAIDRLLATTRATSREGAIASLEHVKYERTEYGDFPEVQEQLLGGLIDSALSFLRSQCPT